MPRRLVLTIESYLKTQVYPLSMKNKPGTKKNFYGKHFFQEYMGMDLGNYFEIM